MIRYIFEGNFLCHNNHNYALINEITRGKRKCFFLFSFFFCPSEAIGLVFKAKQSIYSLNKYLLSSCVSRHRSWCLKHIGKQTKIPCPHEPYILEEGDSKL